MLKQTTCVRTLDRRAHRRHRPRALAPVTVLVLPALRSYDAYVKDLAEGGAGLRVRGQPPAPGARLLVRFPGPGGGTTHTALAEVVHSRGGEEGGYALIGCRFLSRPAFNRMHESLLPGG
jgi:hypothetical protein